VEAVAKKTMTERSTRVCR